jgi:Flp pilus assembly protein TadD
VRLAAARLLADQRPDTLADAARQRQLQQAFDEYLAAQHGNAERAESWVNMAYLHFLQGDPARAEQDYAQARRRNPRYEPTYANQADMYRALGREGDSERVLREGLQNVPDSAALNHALGLSLIRSGQKDRALSSLKQAHRLGADQPRYGFVFGIALQGTGDDAGAVTAWESVVARHPNHIDTLRALTKALYQVGEYGRALAHAQRIAELTPTDGNWRQIVESIREAARQRR